MRDSLLQSGLCRSGLVTQRHHRWKTNVLQSLPNFIGCQIRPETLHCSACAKALPIYVGHFYHPRALRGTSGGLHTSNSSLVYIAIVRSMLEYAAAAWTPWLSPPTSLRKFSWWRPEPLPAFSFQPHLKQFPRNPCGSKPSPIKKQRSGSIIHQPTIDVTRYSPHADSARRGKTGATLNFSV